MHRANQPNHYPLMVESSDTNLLGFAFLNVNGLSRDKIDKIIPLTMHNDIVFLAETWSLSLTQLRSLPTFVTHATGPRRTDQRRADGGICCLARPGIKQSITVTQQTDNSISILIDGKVRVTCLYLPPSLTPQQVEIIMTNIPQSDIIIGDFNIRLGTLTNDTTRGPSDRIEVIQQWQTRRAMNQIIPETTTRTDHIYSIFHGKATTIEPPCTTDHKLLITELQIPRNLKRNSALQTLMAGTKRLHLHKLTDVNTKNRLIGSYMAKSYRISQSIAKVEAQIRQANNFFGKEQSEMELKNTAILKNNLIDQIDSDLKNSIFQTAKDILGVYNVDTSKNGKPPIQRLEENPSNLNAIRLFKIACRPGQKTIQSNNVNQSLRENVMDHFNNVFARPPIASNSHDHFRFPAKQGLSMDTLNGFASTPANNLQDFITVDLVKSLISKYDNSKACGDDSIHNRLLQALINTDLPLHLCSLFRICAQTGITPRRWNISILHPIPKTPDANTIDKCRPIALSVMFRRLFEACILRFWNSTNKHSTTLKLSRLQAGFRRGYSTLTHAAASNDTIHIQGGTYKYRCFIDLKQAYDRVPIELVIQRLRQRNLNQGEISLVTSLFCGCSTVPVVNGHKLGEVNMYRGLFQGSLLSPILFNIFIDDLSTKLDNERLLRNNILNHLLLADDLQLIAKYFEHLRELIRVFDEWASTNGMEPCAPKSGYLGPKLTSNQKEQLQLSGQLLPIVQEYKYIGFAHDKNGINWNAHFHRLSNKSSKLIAFCQANGSGWPEWVKISIYKVFIRPGLEYGAQLISTLPTNLTQSPYAELEQIQAKALSWILPSSKNMTISAALLGIPTIANRFKQLGCTFVLHLKNMDPANPCQLIHQKLRQTPPWRSEIILPRAFLNKLYATLSIQTGPDTTLKTLLRRWTLETLASSRTGKLISTMARQNRYGPDFTTAIRDPVLRKAAIAWRINTWGHQRLCPHEHKFRKSCLTQCETFQQIQVQTETPDLGTPHKSALDDALNTRNLDLFRHLLQLLESKLL